MIETGRSMSRGIKRKIYNNMRSRYLRTATQDIFKGDFETEWDEDTDTMEKEEILRTLISCGLSEYESKVYTSLVFLGTSKAGTISKDSDVPQSKIYEVLEQLMEKQLVQVFNGRPKEFRAVEPEFALKNLLENKTRKIDQLKKKIDDISDFLKPIKKEETLSGIWTTKGEKFREFFNKTGEMLRRSEEYVYAITRDFSRSSNMAGEIKRCLSRGVRIRVIGMESVNKRNYYKAKWYQDQGIDLRIFETKVHPRIVVVDGKEILMRLDYEPKKRKRFRFSSLWSEDPSLVNVMDSYVKNMWESAKAIDFDKIKIKN